MVPDCLKSSVSFLSRTMRSGPVMYSDLLKAPASICAISCFLAGMVLSFFIPPDFFLPSESFIVVFLAVISLPFVILIEISKRWLDGNKIRNHEMQEYAAVAIGQLGIMFLASMLDSVIFTVQCLVIHFSSIAAHIFEAPFLGLLLTLTTCGVYQIFEKAQILSRPV